MPEAGFELDSFEISALPRRPSLELVRSIVRAGGAVRESRRILKRRRPDVVLGAGSFVAGPMVVAASSMRIPTALTEADAHLGLANRLAAPFAERVFLSYELDGRGPPKYRVVGRPIPARSRAVPRGEARERLGLPPDGKILGVFGARAGATALNDFAVETWGESGPVVLHLSGERDHDELRPRVRRPDYHLLPTVDDFGAALSAVDLALSRSGGTVWELAAAGLPAVLVPYPHATADHQAKNAALLRTWRRRRRRARAAAERGAGGRRVAPRGRLETPGDDRRDARPRARGRSREDRRGGARACSRSPVDGCTSSGSAAPGSPATRCSRTSGVPTCRAGTATRRPISRISRRRSR